MKERDLAKHIASLVILLIFGVLAAGSINTDSDTKQVRSKTPDYGLSANELYNEYKANEVAADAKFKGKVVVVSGTIDSIGKDLMDQAYVVIGGKGFLDGVQCTFTKGEESSVARLSKGQHVTIKGEVAGKMGNVLVNKSSLQ
jgi:tRNA_anti-like